jgi:ribosome-binding protein aMBF1 (putative translation factor)
MVVNKVRSIRERLGISQSDLARALWYQSARIKRLLSLLLALKRQTLWRNFSRVSPIALKLVNFADQTNHFQCRSEQK